MHQFLKKKIVYFAVIALSSCCFIEIGSTSSPSDRDELPVCKFNTPIPVRDVRTIMQKAKEFEEQDKDAILMRRAYGDTNVELHPTILMRQFRLITVKVNDTYDYTYRFCLSLEHHLRLLNWMTGELTLRKADSIIFFHDRTYRQSSENGRITMGGSSNFSEFSQHSELLSHVNSLARANLLNSTAEFSVNYCLQSNATGAYVLLETNPQQSQTNAKFQLFQAAPHDFNPLLYISLYEDLRNVTARMDDGKKAVWATWHYCLFGSKKGRNYIPADFDAQTYIALHEQLRSQASSHQDQAKWAKWHYITHGFKQGLVYK